LGCCSSIDCKKIENFLIENPNKIIEGFLNRSPLVTIRINKMKK